MNTLSILRILKGPARKFLWGKVRERLSRKQRIVLPPSTLDPRVQLEQARNHSWIGGVTEEELQHWMLQHPTSDTSMWAVGMDVGIRLHNLCIGSVNVQGTREAHRNAIVVHARWLWDHLETSGGMATSHLLGGLLGMVAAAAYVQDPWLENHGIKAAAMLSKEIQSQILPDGMSFEASTAYHRHVADIFVWSTLSMTQHVGMAAYLDDRWWKKLTAMMNALHVLEDIGMPLIGDNDDGMAVKVNGVFPAPASSAALWDAYTRMLGRHEPSPPSIPSHTSFEDFGLDIWQRSRYTLTARCGDVGQYGKGGHAHNDANSITLAIDGEAFLIDSGSYVYTADPQRRNVDRSTNAHCTVASAMEQQTWPDGLDGLFWLFPSKPRPKVLERGIGRWRGKVVHQGKRGWEHERTITVEDSIIRITDDVGYAMTTAKMILVLAPGINVDLQADHAWLHSAQRSVLISGLTRGTSIEACSVSPAYQVTQQSQRIVVPISGRTLRWAITLRS